MKIFHVNIAIPRPTLLCHQPPVAPWLENPSGPSRDFAYHRTTVGGACIIPQGGAPIKYSYIYHKTKLLEL
jgi:hypothetical protein